MSEWVTDQLGALVDFQKGRKVETSPFQLSGYESYLGAGSLAGGHDGYASIFLSVQANKNDVLMLWDGERSGLVGHNLSGVVSSTVSRLSSNGKITSSLLYYYLLLNFEWIQNRRTGTGVPHVPKDLARMLKLKYPVEKNYQNKIVLILETLDQAIEKTEALIHKYQQIKAGLMHDLFTRGLTADGKLRPPREQAPELYQETPIGWIPKEWDYEPISPLMESLVDGPFGSNLKTEHYVIDTAGVRVVRLQNIQAINYNDTDKAYVSERHANYLMRNKVVSGDILIAGLGEDRYPVGRACQYPHDLPPAINKADCFRLRCKAEEADHYFVMLYLNTPSARAQVRRYEQGVTRPRINLSNMKKIVLPKPLLKEQKAISKRLLNAVLRIEQELLVKDKFKKQKLGLMHDLLTGKVPVTIDQAETAHV
ncbi:MAG: restriction endonuclease subunit S [Desulfobulbaceae bacterium]|nr:restriction endonuclease subunit S [Desulfobulbaceae bacterium]